jgi:integrase
MARRTRGKGEGSIPRRRQDGRWIAQMDLGWINGKRRRKSFYAKSRAEAAVKLNDALAAQRRGAPVPTGRRAVSQHMAAWLETILPPAVNISTWTSYELLNRVHIEPAIGKIPNAKLTHEHVQAFLNEKARAAGAGRGKTGLSITSIKHIRTVLRQALGLAIKDNLMALNPATMVKLPKSRRPPISPLSGEQTRTLLAAAKGTRLEALLVVALRLGLRRGEIVGLEWRDVNLDAMTLSVERSVRRVKGQQLAPGPLKTEESRRTIPLPDESSHGVARPSGCASQRPAEGRCYMERFQPGLPEHDRPLLRTAGRQQHIRPAGREGRAARHDALPRLPTYLLHLAVGAWRGSVSGLKAGGPLQHQHHRGHLR